MRPRLNRQSWRQRIALLLEDARSRTLELVEALSAEDLARQHDPLMSPIVWDLGHIAHFEEVWLVENLMSGATGSEGLRGIYDPFDNPRSVRDELPLPSLPECCSYLASVRDAALEGLDAIATATPDDVGGDEALLEASAFCQMVLQHEYQHNETILQTMQLMREATYVPVRGEGPRPPPTEAPEPGDMVRFPGGDVTLGAARWMPAYDNERPAHVVSMAPFWIDVYPTTNAEYREFLEDGGYKRPEFWSASGWAWKEEGEEERLVAPRYWTNSDGAWSERFMDRTEPLDPRRPVSHVCYWEADAYARWAGKRLPTEQEWETAASWNPERGAKRTYPWGEDLPNRSVANLDALLFQTTPVGSYPHGASAIGCQDMLGNVWEWTSTDFYPYPGYETYPYPEYSEAFFGDEYKVLRGGSWATRFGAVRNTFRNWDYAIRRQIFSGVRCARDD